MLDSMEHRGTIPPGLPKDSPTSSYWQDPPDAIADCRTTDTLPTEADVVIIGSGVSGSNIAYNLLTAKPELDIVLIEARQAASGASGRNGGHTKTASWRSFLDNVQHFGQDDAVKIARLEYNCMLAVHDFIRNNMIDCDARRCDTVDVFYDEQQLQLAQESVRQMQQAMDSSNPAPRHEFYNSHETAAKFLVPNSFGSVVYEAGSLSAYKFTIGVLKLALKLGLNLQCNTPATGIERTSEADTGHKWIVKTNRGNIKTKKLVLATNGYTAHLYPPLQGRIVPLYGVCTAQRPGMNLPQTGLDHTYSFIYKRGFEYMISRQKGTKYEGDIVIGGGLCASPESEVNHFGNTNDNEVDQQTAKYLAGCTEGLFKDNWGEDHGEGRLRRVWSGVMGFSADGHPLVGKLPNEEGLFIDASFQGHGMVLCFLCAKAAANIILDCDGPDLDSWFPRCYRVTEQRLKKTFTGRF